MNKKIIACTLGLFLSGSASVVVSTENQTKPLPILGQNPQGPIEKNIQKALHTASSEKTGPIITVLKQHPYKIATSLASICIAGASYLAYNKYKEQLLINRLAKELNNAVNELKKNETVLAERKTKITSILDQYSKKIQLKALLAQDEKGDTIIHRALEVHPITADPTGQKASANNEFIFFLIEQCKDTDTKITLLNTKNNQGISAYHAIHKNFTSLEKSFIRGWDAKYFITKSKLLNKASVAWTNKKPLVIKLF